MKYVDKIFAVSNFVKEFLKFNGIKNIDTVYNGIDVKNWEADSEKTEKFKEEHNLKNKKIILFGGRLSPAKGSEAILKSIVLVSKKTKNAILLVAGKKDWHVDAMVKLADKLGIGSSVKFTGWLNREEMKLAFFASDICVTPSVYLDPFNLFNIEAGAAKKPVIGTCFGGTPEIVLDGKTGYIVNPNKTELMAEKIVDLLENPEKARKFGEAGYERVKNNFSLDKQVEETLKWYENKRII